MDADLDIDDFLFWDVNDDSLFVENDEFLASFMTEGGGGDINGTTTEGATGGTRPAAVKKHNKPMLSKDDKRRTYAKMFSEAFNSGDIKQLGNFVQNYCTAECVMIQKSVVAANSYIPKYVEVFGSSAILEFWANTFLTVPDCLMVMLETKLRIRNRQFQQQGLGGGKSSFSVDEIHYEGSSIVCSFSFTGTKIYTTKMEGAVIQPPGMISSVPSEVNMGNGSNSTSTLPASDSTLSMQTLDSGGAQNLNAQQLLAMQGGFGGLPLPKPAKQSKKRSFSAINETASGATSSAATTASTNNGNSAVTATMGPSESSIDKFNIFLHPPRKYSTLAGTPFGGSPHYYTKNQHAAHHTQQVAPLPKMSDYISINSNTKFSTGSFMEQEGYINFLGTLTMTLDSDNKINKFEFIYSHMD